MSSPRYTHGHHESVLRSHEWRTAQNSAGFLLEHLRSTDHVLDVGCGPGNITADLARYVLDGSIRGIDLSADVVARAARRHLEVPVPHLTFEVDDVYRLHSPDETYDVVYIHQTLQHLHDPIAALSEIRRVLRPGGLLAARDADFGGFVWHPHDAVLDAWMALYHRVTKRNGAQADGGRHLVSWVLRAGFDVTSVTSSTWTYQSPVEREWWGGLWAERTQHSDFARQAVEYGLATPDELEAIAEAFRDWARHDDAIFVVPSVEVLARR